MPGRMSHAFYVPDGRGFAATELTRGPWDPEAQHAGPPSALLAREIERCQPRAEMQVTRITLEILRPVPLARLECSARVVRPGRSVELVEAELRDADGGRELMRARAWRIRTADVGLPEITQRGFGSSGPDEGEDRPFPVPMADAKGYWSAMDYRFVSGAFKEPGPALVWLRMRVALVEGEEPSPLVRVMAAADSGNGVSAALDWREWMFINTDLTVHLHRMPEGEWVGLDSETVLEPGGIGMSDTLLGDERGAVGRALQSLLVGPRR
jgi:hypothetical protein